MSTITEATEKAPKEMGYPKVVNQHLRRNRRWFLDTIRAAGLTQRAIADRLGIDESAVHHMLHGRRHLHLEEVPELARILGVDSSVVAEKAGVNLLSGVSNKDSVPIRGWVDGKGNVHLKTPTRGPRKAPMLHAGMANMAALRVIAPEKGLPGLSSLDGALLYYPRQADHQESDWSVDPECLGRPSIVKTVDGRTVLRVVSRGYGRGTYTLAQLSGETKDNETDVELEWGSPIVVQVYVNL